MKGKAARLVALLAWTLLSCPAPAEEVRDVTVKVFPPEAEVRAFLPGSPPAEGDGVSNGGNFQVREILSLPLRLSAPGYATQDLKANLLKDLAVSPGQWIFEYELVPIGLPSQIRHEFRRHPARSYGGAFVILAGLGGLGVWVKRRARFDTDRAESARLMAEFQTSAALEKLDEVTPEVVGRVIDSYQILSLLGEGGFAKVYKARHVDYDDLFALKMLRPDVLDRGIGDRVEREMTIGRDLIHPNLVRTFGFGTFRESPYLVLEFVSGQTLDDKLSTERLPIPSVLAILKALAHGLEYAHQKGVIHRDLKPANIFLTAEGGVKILDFGVAKILDTQQRLTLTGQALGTPYYMSPEQARGQAGVGSDIYALGVIAFEMLTGLLPFDGESAIEVLTAHTFADAPAVRKFNPEVSESFEELLLTMMAKLPQQRPESMSVVLERLEQVRV